MCLPVTELSTITPAEPLPGELTPTVRTRRQGRTDAMADPGGRPVSLSVQRGNPVVTSYALTVRPKPMTATPLPAAAAAWPWP